MDLPFTASLPHCPHSEVRIMGLDLGRKRIGVALSDALGITAQGLMVLERQDNATDLARIIALARQHHITGIVIGLPRHMNGRLGASAAEVFDWVAQLQQALAIPVHTWDERLTTVQAERILLDANLSRRRRRQVIDKMAAVLILQAFLDQRRPSP
ncbi:MAG: Holliday junction resolvase RuvX [Deltaproteobacteria bacterium]|nr:Holliday junction resolvase RuvX [Deltaproteobacteria bacterium]MBW1952692.1 Holliday junction resolvase RuvX [Deltaproteobacteria bacterium]MBW1985796.1 Holliday junction resolvase RuvX [Deltaproteobacteria bacterium]MBW2133886.1 Holliday junction resolvase RuvX [Deltaproteobacteria bacterium]